MIKLYRGKIKLSVSDRVVFERNDDEILQACELLIGNRLSKDESILKSRYYLFLTLKTNFLLNTDLSVLEDSFPNFVWTKIIQTEEMGYKFEFLPVSTDIEDASRKDCFLIGALNQMNFDPEHLGEDFVLNFKKVVQETVFKNKELPTLSRLKRIRNELKEFPDSDEVESKDTEKSSIPRSIDNFNDMGSGDKAISILEEIKKKNKRTQLDLISRKARIKKRVFNVLTVLFFFSVSYIIFTSFYSLAFVQGDSMKPTIQENELLLIQKHPQTIERGNLISFKMTQLGTDTFVKRVVGIPGDTVEASGGTLYINGKKYDKRFTKDFDLKEISGRVTVPEKKFFVLGDNRSHSTDSRSFGFVDADTIKGKVINK
jgi:signal peptidase I